MGRTTKLILFLPLILCFTCGQGISSSPRQCSKSGTQQGAGSGLSSDDWNVLVLTQYWPPAACLLLEHGQEKCNITKLKSWVIHGLWPTKAGTEEPNFCNPSAEFDPSKVQVLQPRLQLNWPSVEKGEDPADVWTHEWCKHGTCGTSLQELRDELHYFNTTLGLHDRFNLAKFLASGRITPSEERTYKYEDVLKALHQAAGSSPTLTCARDKTNGKCYLEQVELCLTKSFKPTDCVRPKSQRRGSGKLALLFEPERAIVRGRREGGTCSCESEAMYYKPLPSM